MAPKRARAKAAEAKESEAPQPAKKRGRPAKEGSEAKEKPEAKAGETPPAAAKRGRPPKRAPAEAEEKPEKGPETPPKAPAKRGRPKSAAAKGTDGDGGASETPPAAGPESQTSEQSGKTPRRAASFKRDKNAPLPRSATPRAQPPDGGRVLRLLSVNVAGLRSVLAGEKAQVLKALVEREAPDVFCLNEHKLKEEDVEEQEAKLKELLPKEYATAHWACSTAKKGYSGVAIFLRHAPDGGVGGIADPGSLVVKRGMGSVGKDDPIIGEEGRLLTLELPELSVVAAYVPNAGADLQRLGYRTDRGSKQCWDREFGEYLRALKESRGRPVVVLGDLNCGHRVQDIWNMYERPDFPEGLAAKPVEQQYTGVTALKKFAGLTVEERSSFPRLLEDAGLVDTFRALFPAAEGVFSYFSMRIAQNRPLNRGLRLDYVLASPELCGSLAPRSAEGQQQEGAAAAAAGAEGGEAPLPRVHDSFVLDEDELVADHAAIGCHVLLPPLPPA